MTKSKNSSVQQLLAALCAMTHPHSGVTDMLGDLISPDVDIVQADEPVRWVRSDMVFEMPPCENISSVTHPPGGPTFVESDDGD